MNIFLSTKADNQLKRLPAKMNEVIIERIKLLADNPFPSGSKKLTNREGWRVRVGDYRILYTINLSTKDLTILSVKHRKEAYKF